MLKALVLENFKAFGGRRVIPIRPLTLLFGPNSAGKSAVLQSLLVLKQTIEDNETSNAPLRMNGSLVDLGNFRQAVHRHDLRRVCEITPILELNDENASELPMLTAIHEAIPNLNRQFGLGLRVQHSTELRAMTLDALSIYFGDADESAVELRDEPEVRNRLRNQGLIRVVQPPMRGSGERALSPTINKNHSMWSKAFSEFRSSLLPHFIERIEDLSTGDDFYDHFLVHDLAIFPTHESFQIDASFIENQIEWYFDYTYDRYCADLERDSLYPPLVNKNLVVNAKSVKHSLVQSPSEDHSVIEPDHAYWRQRHNLLRYLLYGRNAGLLPNVAQLAIEISQRLRHLLERVIYLGPMRDSPDRYFLSGGTLPIGVGRSGSMTAEVLATQPDVLQRTNETLNAFNIGYRVEASRLRDEQEQASDIYALRLIDTKSGVRASLRDVGFGISQVLPVLVQGLIAQENVVAIEQPELHLHPRLQTELADVFIQSALGGRNNTFLLETHSEHLILRIMRRMRETSNGTLPPGIPPIRPDDVSIIYVQPTPDGSVPLVMDIDEEGQLMSAWPNGFFEEGFHERFA